MNALQQRAGQTKPADIRAAWLQRKSYHVTTGRIDFQRHARSARSFGTRGAFAKKSFAQHHLRQISNAVWTKARPLVQLQPTKASLGPQHPENLSLTSVDHEGYRYSYTTR